MRLSLAACPQHVDHFVVLRESPGFVLREDHLIIDNDVEDAIATLNERRVDAERLPDAGRQTGGLGAVLSPPAIGDRDSQAVLLASVRCALQRHGGRAHRVHWNQRRRTDCWRFENLAFLIRFATFRSASAWVGYG